METKNPHIVVLDELELGSYDLDFQLDDAWFKALEKSEILSGQVRVQAHLSIAADGFTLSLDLNGMVQLTCDRCLEPVDLPVELKMDTDSSDEDLAEAKSIDLAWLAYEWIVVNLPIVHCHPAGGCNPAMDALLQDHLCRTEEDPEEL